MKLSGRAVVVFAWLLTLPLVTPRIRGADEIEYFAFMFVFRIHNFTKNKKTE